MTRKTDTAQGEVIPHAAQTEVTDGTTDTANQTQTTPRTRSTVSNTDQCAQTTKTYPSPDPATTLINQILREGGRVNLPYILSLTVPGIPTPSQDQRTYNREYQRIYRLAHNLADQDLITLERGPDGLLWLEVTANGLLLVRSKCKIQTPVKPPGGLYNLPQRARPERIEACKIALECSMLDRGDLQDINDLFNVYLDEVQARRIVMRRRDDAPTILPPYMILPCKTRYTDPAYRRRNLDNYETAIAHSLTTYETAVHLVLTTDPGQHKSLWHSWRALAPAWNRFKTRLNKTFGRTHQYIAAYEFTRSGLLHMHVLIFGIPYLLPVRQISDWWRQAGQGRYVYVYALRRSPQGWIYARNRPKTAKKGQTADQYLAKYLKKSLFDASSYSLYWVTAKRYTTYSRAISALFPRRAQEVARWEFLASMLDWQIPPNIWDVASRCWVPPPVAYPVNVGGPPNAYRIPIPRYPLVRSSQSL